MTELVTTHTTGRSLISAYLFDRLVTRLKNEERLEHGLAERIMDQALAFLGTCARDHDTPLAPSTLVDLGWHTFVLHTREYAAFCQRVAGRFLHHVPTEPGDHNTGKQSAALADTVRAITAAGFHVDAALWPHGNAADCTGCHQGCHDDPPPPPRVALAAGAPAA